MTSKNSVLVALLFSLLFPFAASAISYLPGQTLDPSCPPSDPTCIVVPNTTSSSFTATSSTATSTFAGNIQVSGLTSLANTVVSGSFTLGNVSGILKAVGGVVSSALVNLTSDVTGVLGIANGGTGTASAPTYGQILVGNSGGGYTLTSTSSLGISGGGGTWGSITGTLSNQTDLQNALNAKFSLASWYATTTDGLAQGSTNRYFSNALAQGAISVSGAPLTYSSGVVGINQANVGQAGYLAAADWAIFNDKISSSSLSAGTGIGYNSATGVISNSGVTNVATSYPLIASGGTGSIALSLGFGTTTANAWNSLQTFTGGSLATASSTIGNGTQAGGLTVNGGATTTGNQYVAGMGKFGSTLALGTVIGCTGGQALQTDSNGNISCGSISVGGTSSGGGWSTNGIGRVNLATSSDLVVIGASTTPYAKLTVLSGANSTTTLALVPNSGQTANILDIYSTAGSLSSVFTAGGFLGLGTTSPGSLLSLNNITNFTTATSTFYSTGGINLSAGCFSVNGTCLAAPSSLLSLNNTWTGTNIFGAATSSAFAITSLKNALLSTDANGNVVASSSIGANLLTGILGIAHGGSGTSTAPAFGQILVGNSGGGYTLTSTSSLGISDGGGTWGSITGTLSSQTDLQNALNGKLASSSLQTSALLAGLVTDETGSGSLVFGTSPTFAGTPVFGGGVLSYSVNSTTTIPNGTPYAWTIATSTSASPLIQVDTSGGSGAVSVGSSQATSSTFTLGSTGQPTWLIFSGTSTIEGAGTGQSLTIGANSDVVNFGVNVGIGTTTPGSIFSINNVANWTGATTTYYSSGGINLSSGCFSINGTCITGSGGGGVTSITGTANQIAASGSTGAVTLSLPSQLNLTNASSSVLSVSGEGFFGTVSTANLIVSGIGGSTQCLQINSLGQVTGTGSACGGSGSTPGGLSGQVQFNSSNIFGGAANLWWSSGSNSLGVGTSTPSGELAISANSGTSYTGNLIFDIASSTPTATTTLFAVSNTGMITTNLDVSTSTFLTLNGQVFITASSTSFNTGLGLSALHNITIGNQNTAFGYQALTTDTSGFQNTAIGDQAMGSGNGGNGNQDVAIGNLALGKLLLNHAINNNVAIGFQTLQGNGSNLFQGSGNTIVGSQALLTPSFTSNLTGIGVNALYQVGYGTSTVAIGATAGYGSTANYTSVADTLLGASSGYNFTTGANYNTLLGYGAGYDMTSGANNILLGSFVDAPSNTGSNQLNIGNILYGTNLYSSTVTGAATSSAPVVNGNIGIGTSTPWGKFAISLNSGDTDPFAFVIASSTASATTTLFDVTNTGNVGVGTTSPAYLFTVDGSSISSTVAAFENANGECTINPTSSSVNCSSDIRLKKNINTIQSSSSLTNVLALNPVYFNWNSEATGTPQHPGFIAQDVQKIFPALVTESDNGTLLLNYAGFAPYFAGAIQEQQGELNAISSTSNASSTPEEQSFAASFFQNVFAKMTQWLASANNGITDLFANTVYAKNKICINKSDGTPVCINGDQLAALLASQTDNGNPSNTPSASTPSQPPIISVNGNNPASVALNSTYSDLGASVVGPVQDLNLGIHATVDDGATTTIDEITIDTSKPGAHTILYFATDQSGETAYATRSVVVYDPASASSTPPVATSSPTGPDISTASNTASASDQITSISTASTSPATTTATDSTTTNATSTTP